MNLSFYIARRYLFSKKSHNAINIISMVSVCGVTLATIALVCALSVFNGFNDLVAKMFSSVDPELVITPIKGKVFNPSMPEIQQALELPEIKSYSQTLQDNAMIMYRDRQCIGVLKGVDTQYTQTAAIDSALIDGEFRLQEDVVSYATLGAGLAYTLGVRVGYQSPLEIYTPKRNENINMANIAASLNKEYAYIGGVFMTSQAVYDDSYIIVPIEITRHLFDYDHEVSSVELKLIDGADIKSVKKKIREIVGEDFWVKDRYEQHEEAFKMMEIEKAITFLILCFVLAIALFNLVGSLSMLMNEKQENIKTLRNLGANKQLVKRIFLFEGWLISGFGAVIGIVVGVALCYLQMKFEFIRLGQQAGAFVIDGYPVQILLSDIILVLVTVLTIGFLSSWYPVYSVSKKWFKPSV